MKYLRFLVLVPLLMAFQCEDDDQVSFDNLEEIGILGRWEIADEVMNGVISDMLPKCCEFLEFNTDENIRDYKGFLTYTDSQGLINSGSFEVDIPNKRILFIDDDNDEFIFEFSVGDSQENLIIDFNEDGTNYTQTWAKIE